MWLAPAQIRSFAPPIDYSLPLTLIAFPVVVRLIFQAEPVDPLSDEIDNLPLLPNPIAFSAFVIQHYSSESQHPPHSMWLVAPHWPFAAFEFVARDPKRFECL